jgi:hypothetical protein
MTLPEFKAWLDGFSEGMGDAPTPEQWAKIKGKLAEVQMVTLPHQIAPMPSPYIRGPSLLPIAPGDWTPPQPVTCISNTTAIDAQVTQ